MHFTCNMYSFQCKLIQTYFSRDFKWGKSCRHRDSNPRPSDFASSGIEPISNVKFDWVEATSWKSRRVGFLPIKRASFLLFFLLMVGDVEKNIPATGARRKSSAENLSIVCHRDTPDYRVWLGPSSAIF